MATKNTTSSESKTTTNHDIIKDWCDQRGGVPSQVESTGKGKKPGVLRIEFPGDGKGDDALEPISWEEFFEKFDKEKLAFLYQEHTKDGSVSRFCKFVDRE